MARTAKSKPSKTNDSIKIESEGFDFDNTSVQADENKINFEEALLKLEIIVKELEAGELSLEDSLAKFAEGVFLSKICLNALNAAQHQIDKILQDEEGRLTLRPFQFQEEATK